MTAAIRRAVLGGDARALLLLGACVAAGVIFLALAPSFGTTANLLTVARNSSELLLVSLGIALLLAMGSIDVSVGITRPFVSGSFGLCRSTRTSYWKTPWLTIRPYARNGYGIANCAMTLVSPV